MPGGDLGIWVEADNGSACTASEMNSLINSAAVKVDVALLTVASMNCILKSDNAKLPAIGEKISIANALKTALDVNNTSYTLTSATIERLADSGSDIVYVYALGLTHTTSNATISFTLKNLSTDGTSHTGKLYSSIAGGLQGMGDSYAYSLLYSKTASKVQYKMAGHNYNAANANGDLFDANGELKFETGLGISGNLTHTLVDIDATSGLGNVSYAWQAGAQDDKTRVFNAYTLLNGSTTEGFGFFGYGASFTMGSNGSAGSVPDNIISTFICNWAGPNNSHTGLVGYAQKQAMTLTGGIFVSSSVNISYAPTSDCNYAGGSNMNWGNSTTAGGGGTPGAAFGDNITGYSTPSDHAAVTHDLIQLIGDTDFGNFTAPVAPTSPF